MSKATIRQVLVLALVLLAVWIISDWRISLGIFLFNWASNIERSGRLADALRDALAMLKARE